MSTAEDQPSTDEAARNEGSSSEGGACLKPKLSDMSNLRLDSKGLCCLGKDGVLRSFSAVGQVIDYRKFSAEQVSDYVETFVTGGACSDEEIQNLRTIFEGVDGREVDDSRCLEPDLEDIPEILLENKTKKTESNLNA